MPLSIHQQNLAKQDLADIWLHSFEHWGEQQADRYFDELANAMALLSENPKLGVTCEYIRKGYRQFPVNRHIIFYTISSSKIHVIRVLGEDMNLKKQFKT